MKEIYGIFNYFIKLGFIGFGGPLALVSQMQNHFVIKKKWIEQSDFNSTFALIKAMPGPIAFMTAVYLGRHRAGFLGALIAGIALNLPAFFMMIFFSLFFSHFSQYPSVVFFMMGMQATSLGVILGSLKGLVVDHLKNALFWILVILSGFINFKNPQYEPIVIIVFGLMIVLKSKLKNSLFDLGTLAFVFFKAGALVFGSGLAIVPMLSHDVVTKHQWLTQSEFIDALAFGQMSPGPVVITATYIGHKVYGFPGALVATLAIFSASFFHMTTWFPRVVKVLKNKEWIKEFVFGAVAAVIGSILVAVYKLSLAMELNFILIFFIFISFLLTVKNKFPLWALIPTGGIVYILLKSF